MIYRYIMICMPHVSQKELGTKTKMQILEAFDTVLGKMNSREVNTFLYSLLSSTEKLMLAKRLSIALLIKADIEQKAIADALGVTQETVHRIELAIFKHPDGFLLAERKIDEDQLMQKFKKLLIGLATYSVRAAGGRVKL